MSMWDNLFGSSSKGSYSNVDSIAQFNKELDQYEASVVLGSVLFTEYRRPADLIKPALIRLIRSGPAETISMMRILTARITGDLDGKYSEYTITMLANATRDEKTQQLVMSIPYVIRELIVGERFDLGAAWLTMIENNATILTFLENYRRSDQAISESYSGVVTSYARDTVKLSLTDEKYVLVLGFANYELKFNNGEGQSIAFEAAPDIREQYGLSEGQRLIITSEVIITPSTTYLTVDKSVDFFDDAIAQIGALHCVTQGYVKGIDTRFQLPGEFYSLSLSVISYDDGKTFRVTEVNILPPSITRSL